MEFVWAKLKGFSAWPAKICSETPANVPIPRHTRNLKCVFFTERIISKCYYFMFRTRFFETKLFTFSNFYCYSSGWISQENISDYIQNKEQFSMKNKSKAFKIAIKEIEEEIEKEIANFSSFEKITLKEVSVDEILATFEGNKMALQNVFDHRRNTLDRFNYGCKDFDFLTVLECTLVEDQKTKMYKRICVAFMGSVEKYIQNPIVSLKKVLIT